MAEDSGRANGAPDNRGGVEDTATRACVVVLLINGADVGDMTEGPVHDDNLHDGRPHRGEELRREHDTRGHFHVVAELQILSKVQGLGHGNIAIILEHHHGKGPTRHHVTNDELGKNVETELDVGDGLNDANGDKPYDRKQQTDNESPGRKASVPASNHAKGDGNHADEQDYIYDDYVALISIIFRHKWPRGILHTSIPPFFSISVFLHQSHMNVVLLMTSHLELVPDLFAMVKADVDEHSGNGGKRQSVGEGKLRGQKEGRVLLVCCFVKGKVVSKDSRNVVNPAEVVVRLR